MNTEISVVILCYGAGERLYDFVDRVIRLVGSSVPSWEIVLVGNYLKGSNDDTPRIVKDIASSRNGVKAVILPKEGMMGWDARTGLNAALGNFICLIDGDEQMPPEDIIRVYRKIKDEGLDFAKTYRVKRHDSFLRRANSRIYNTLFHILFPGINVRDANSKPKIFSREAYRKMGLKSDDWFIDAEALIQAGRLGLKVGEVPTEFFENKYRKSYVKVSAIFEFIKNLALARLGGFFR